MKSYKFRLYHTPLGRMFYSDSQEDAKFWHAKVGDSAFATFAQQFALEFVDNRNGRLMQFTGLLDKQGKEIYEGDIITTLYNPKYVVELTQIWQDYGYYSDGWREFESEVVGNIYENKDLIK